MHISEKQVNITPTSISQPTTANQQLEVANIQTGRAANVSLDTANDEEDHRPNRTTATQPQRQLKIIKQMQQTTKRIDKGHCQQHPQSIQLRMPQQITMEYHMT